MSIMILGTGSAVPQTVVTNNDLSAFLDTSDAWISTRTGINERHVLKDETLLDLSVRASAAALGDAGLDGGDIDMVICSTVQGDYITPAMSCLISKEINPGCAYVFDINMGCSGFIYALDLADTYLSSGKAKRALIVCAEGLSRLVDWTDRATCVLFGDGAGAVVVEAGEGLMGIRLSVDGSKELLNIPALSGNCPFGAREKTDNYMYVNGQEVYKFAVNSVIRDVHDLMNALGLTPDDIAYYIFHQANKRIIEAVRTRLEQSEAKFPLNIQNYGNTSSASIPILLDELNKNKKFKRDDILLLSAFGSGLTTGIGIVKWCKD